MGAPVSQGGLSSPTEPCSTVSALAGFDPSRFFPFTLRAVETPKYTSSPHDFRTAFLANKPQGVTWFAYDVVVKSRTLVEFVVYDMRDTCFGGIGNRVARFDAEVDRSVTDWAVEAELLRHALRLRAEQLKAAEDTVVASYADELRDAIATEARRAETENTGSVHEGAGPKDIAQGQSDHA